LLLVTTGTAASALNRHREVFLIVVQVMVIGEHPVEVDGGQGGGHGEEQERPAADQPKKQRAWYNS
jgi:hypothetical protein